MVSFRFQDLEIWKESVPVSRECFVLAEKLRRDNYYSLSDQLLRASLSISNNIAEGSGSATKKDFANYLNIARRSTFECANIIILLHEYGIISQDYMDKMLILFKNLSAKIYYFRKRLITN
ncbi:MAG: four helix bundle protein [Bacteroidales bacterium]|nr:four helix bundle protein [Bacteroidales bacterium]